MESRDVRGSLQWHANSSLTLAFPVDLTIIAHDGGAWDVHGVVVDTDDDGLELLRQLDRWFSMEIDGSEFDVVVSEFDGEGRFTAVEDLAHVTSSS